MTEGRHGYFIIDYENSKGNFIKDIDQNILLDSFMNIATIALGYNHPEFVEFA